LNTYKLQPTCQLSKEFNLSKLKTYVQNYFSKFQFALLVLVKKLVPLSNSCVDSTKHVPIQIQVTINEPPSLALKIEELVNIGLYIKSNSHM